MNIYDVSGKAEISIVTVPRILNGNPNVSEKTRNRVLNVMKELGYTSDAFARGLGLGTIKTIGIMYSGSSDLYLASTIYYLERELRANGYDSILYCMGNPLDTRQKCFNLLLSKWVDATILAGFKFVELEPKDNAYIPEAAKDPPIVLASGYLDGSNIYSAVCDDHVTMYQAAESLITTGHDNILYLYTSYSYSSQNKMQGYKNALVAHHISVSEELIHQCSRGAMASRELLLQLRDSGLGFNGVMTSDSSLAVSAMKPANQKGIRAPNECLIIGYSNSILSPCTDPELTSIDTRAESLYTTIVNALMGVFGGDNVPSKTTIAADFVKRQTTKSE